MNYADEALESADRRGLLATFAAGAALVAAGPAVAAAASPVDGAEAAFRRAFANGAGGALDPDARLAFLAAEASIVDHDVPYPMDRAAYADHLRFLTAHWERVEWSIHDLRVAGHEGAAVVSCFYNERGKPRDAGFRLRPGFCTAVCSKSAAGWRAVALHMSPLSAQIIDASPS